jgi:hypothetical protein
MTKREQVLIAVAAALQALPYGRDFKRNADKPASLSEAGAIRMRDGDLGDPEVLLSPLQYTFSHRIPVELFIYKQSGKTKEQVLDEAVAAISSIITGNRTLNGLCEWLEAELQSPDDFGVTGAEAGLMVSVDLIATYTTTSPTG